jgi:large subunit ribosomal protein L23
MALRDLFKRKKKKEITKREVEQESKIESARDKDLKAKREVKAGNSSLILKSPHVTEKAVELTEKNQYVFNVFKRASKNEIKKSIENLYGVDVLKVNIVNIPEKPRRWARKEGFKKGYKKAIVKIKEGQKIEVLPR